MGNHVGRVSDFETVKDLGNGFVFVKDVRSEGEIWSGVRVKGEFIVPADVALTVERADGKRAKIRFPQMLSYMVKGAVRTVGHSAALIPGAGYFDVEKNTNVGRVVLGPLTGVSVIL